MANVAVNRPGGIGRAALKVILETPQLNLVAANDVATATMGVKQCRAHGQHFSVVNFHYQRFKATGPACPLQA